MRKRVKMLLCMIAGVVTVLMMGVVSWVALNSRDIAGPDVSDLVLESVALPDANNAYAYFSKAGELLRWVKNESRMDAILEDRTRDEALVADLISRNAETLALLKQGLACATYQPHAMPEPNGGGPIQRYKLSKFMALKAACERRMRHKDEAWKTSFDLIRLGSLVAANPNGFVDCMAAVKTLSWGLTEAKRLLGEWPPDEAQLTQLLDWLNGVPSIERAYTRAVKAEFRVIADGADQLSAAIPHEWFGAYIFQPNKTKQMGAEYYRTALRGFSEPYAQVRLPDPKLFPMDDVHRHLLLLRPNSQGHVLLAMLLVAPDRIHQFVAVKCTMQSHLDGLRLIVACRLYEMHHGRLPQTLEALVPEWLGAVPQDPFDGKPFRYSRADAVVYSVGKDLQDSWVLGVHGPDALTSNRPSGKTDDLVYHIHGETK